MTARAPLQYFINEHAEAGLTPPNDRAIDLATRCWRCHRFRYFDVNNEGSFVDGAWMCGCCIGVMDGRSRPPKRFVFSDALLRWRVSGNNLGVSDG